MGTLGTKVGKPSRPADRDRSHRDLVPGVTSEANRCTRKGEENCGL